MAKRTLNLSELNGKTLAEDGSNTEFAVEGVHYNNEVIAPANTANKPRSHKIAPTNLPFAPI